MKTIWVLITVLVLSIVNSSYAELVSDGVWQIQQGDSMDSILEEILPGESARYPRLQKLIYQFNQGSFDQDGKLIIGKTLRLPGEGLNKTTVSVSDSIGKVIIASGPIWATRAGRRVPLKNGSFIFSGDTLVTGQGHTQVRFVDGTLVAIQPGTKFKIDEYHYKGKQDGSERSAYRLLKGGLRTITGVIGKENPDAYEMKTPVAMIGVRGTDFSVTHEQSEGTSVGVTEGKVLVRNQTGTVELGVGQRVRVISVTSKLVPVSSGSGVLSQTNSDEISQAEAKSTDEEDDMEKVIVVEEGSAFTADFSEIAASSVVAKEPVFEIGKDAKFVSELEQVVMDALAPPEPSPTASDYVKGDVAPELAVTHLASINANVDTVNANSAAYQNSNNDVEVRTERNHTVVVTYVGPPATRGQSPPEQTAFNANYDALALGSLGRDDVFLVKWGRWDRKSDVQLSSADIDRSTHYIYQEHSQTLNLTELTALKDNAAFADSASALRLHYSGGTVPANLNQGAGVIDVENSFIELDLTTAMMTNYNLTAMFADNERYVLQLADTIGLDEVVSGGDIALTGICSGGGACGSSVALEGSATAGFLLGEDRLGAMSSFAAQASEAPQSNHVGVVGVALFASE